MSFNQDRMGEFEFQPFRKLHTMYCRQTERCVRFRLSGVAFRRILE